MSRRFYDFDDRFARDQEREPSYRGRPRFPVRNPTEQREQSAEDIAIRFGRSFVKVEGES